MIMVERHSCICCMGVFYYVIIYKSELFLLCFDNAQERLRKLYTSAARVVYCEHLVQYFLNNSGTDRRQPAVRPPYRI